jgi:hypothetical protein
MMEVYYTPMFNTQLLITINNSSRILTHVQLLPVLEHNSQIMLQLNPAGKYTSYLFAFQNTTVNCNS